MHSVQWYNSRQYNLSLWWMCKHWAGPKQLPGDHPCACEISRNASYQASCGPFPQHRDACFFLHSNTLIYSLLKLNTAANTPSDSITLCPHRSANEGCTLLIKFQSAIEMFKMCLIECWRWRLPSHGYIPDLFEDTQALKFQIRALHISHASVIQTRWWCLEASVASCHVFPG